MKSNIAITTASIIWLTIIAASAVAVHLIPHVVVAALAAYRLYEWTADGVIICLRFVRERRQRL
jgi:hypothetical protein